MNNKSSEVRILHVDMDAFFAAIEQRDNPGLKGKPVIVGGLPGSRGVVATCSYEARAFGVTSGMPLTEALRLCPKGIFLQTNGRKYTSTAIQLIEMFHHYTPVVEPVSIDESYLDITGSIKLFGNEQTLAVSLKQEIRHKLELTCSVGIAHTRVYAKLATGLHKPNGLTILHKTETNETVYPLPVEKLWGVGEKTSRALHELGVYTIGDLARYPEQTLSYYFGVNGKQLSAIARGESCPDVLSLDERPDEKSIGHEHTFGTDVRDIEVINNTLLRLAQKVGRRLRAGGFAGRTIALKLRYCDFETHTIRETNSRFLRDDCGIYYCAKYLFNKLYLGIKSVRLVGISLSSLVRINASVFGDVQPEDIFLNGMQNHRIVPVMDRLRDKFGEDIITRCAAQ